MMPLFSFSNVSLHALKIFEPKKPLFADKGEG
jgi:hypothetical protein